MVQMTPGWPPKPHQGVFLKFLKVLFWRTTWIQLCWYHQTWGSRVQASGNSPCHLPTLSPGPSSTLKTGNTSSRGLDTRRQRWYSTKLLSLQLGHSFCLVEWTNVFALCIAIPNSGAGLCFTSPHYLVKFSLTSGWYRYTMGTNHNFSFGLTFMDRTTQWHYNHQWRL